VVVAGWIYFPPTSPLLLKRHPTSAPAIFNTSRAARCRPAVPCCLRSSSVQCCGRLLSSSPGHGERCGLAMVVRLGRGSAAAGERW
jgi:hypothetical protein